MDYFQCHADKPANGDFLHSLNHHEPAHGFDLAADSESLARDMETIIALESQEP